MRNLDLKDLEILDAVYKTRNVSQASDKVELSQPTISIRLGRLRKHFRDPLFVRTSVGMQPTPRADALIPAIQQALALFGGSLRQQDAFDPRTSDRKFRICMTDVGQFVTLPLVLDRMKFAAPSVRIEVLTLNADAPRFLESGDADTALGFTLDIPPGFYQQALVEDHFVCVVSRDHPRIGARMTRRQFATERQIDVVTKGTGHWLLLYKALEDAKISRRVAIRVPSFLGLAQIVAHSDLLALVPARLGKIFAQEGNVRALAAPIKLPSYVVKHYWHERYHRDPGNIWLRSLIADVMRERLKG
jgi:DNA-binding transcriptional LysR family regulator